MNKILNILSWFFLVAAMGLLMSFSAQKRAQQTYSDIQILIDKPENSRFVTTQNIATLFTNLGYGKENQPLNRIDINDFELQLERKPAIASANVYQTLAGKIIVEITERQPIIRIYNNTGKSFYLDKNGSFMPLSNQYTAHVPIASGSISIPFSTVYELEDLEQRIHKIFRKANTTAVQNIKLIKELKVEEEKLPGANQLQDLFNLARFIDQNSFWKSQISQIHVNEKGDYEFIPRVGNHTIVFGKANDIEDKFEKLMTFYKKGLNKTGWNEYSTINLKFKNQVVCTKR
jgi:cell division protein FtsQ